MIRGNKSLTARDCEREYAERERQGVCGFVRLRGGMTHTQGERQSEAIEETVTQ